MNHMSLKLPPEVLAEINKGSKKPPRKWRLNLKKILKGMR
jgi:hypothetical protein